MLKENTTKGKLIVVEGIDGSGKSTQIDLLYKWLQSQGYSVFFSEWNSSPLVKTTTKAAKKEKSFTPTTFSILHCTDFADRWENSIYPLLKAGAIVLADRYVYTAFARDVARGVDPEWVRNMYSFAIKPDVAFYFRVPLDIAVERITAPADGSAYNAERAHDSRAHHGGTRAHQNSVECQHEDGEHPAAPTAQPAGEEGGYQAGQDGHVEAGDGDDMRCAGEGVSLFQLRREPALIAQ